MMLLLMMLMLLNGVRVDIFRNIFLKFFTRNVIDNNMILTSILPCENVNGGEVENHVV